MRMICAGFAVLLLASHALDGHTQDQNSAADTPSITVTVPLMTADFTDRVNGFQVDCTLRTAADEIVANGTTYILASQLSGAGSDFINGHVITQPWADVLYGNIEADETVDVDIVQNEGYQIEGWVHGRCDLLLMNIDQQEQTSATDAPIECGLSPPNNQLHLCAFPGSEFVSSVEFLRPGFNRDGTLETLPGVD